METFYGWRSVPWHLMTRTQLGELEFPRAPADEALVGEVVTSNWRGRRDEFELFDVRRCSPTSSTSRQLAAAEARRSTRRPRRCSRCQARTQRPLAQLDCEPGPLCPLCRHLSAIERDQRTLAAERPRHAARAAELLAQDQAAVLVAERIVPPPTPAGRTRPATAARVHAVAAGTGRTLVDVTARLVGPRARFVPDAAVERDQAVEQLHHALLHRPLIAWSEDDLHILRELADHPDLACWDSPVSLGAREHRNHAAATISDLATRWRGQLDVDGQLLRCLHPGGADRLVLLLQRIAADTVDEQTADVLDAG